MVVHFRFGGHIVDPDYFKLEMFRLSHRILSMDPFLHADFFFRGERKIQDYFLVSET